ncbi:segregation/condensation protein A [Dulcicalothrix desertica PCC 7102]|uniref:Segregation and condensation protein A n=1 Tax=Dulcicalothrix desertica PCC 7102 TaxID=232991 RepID=A0A3S1AGX7_9CYAN|nr:ScpA family protein [Dulcicalothrix desertica]RUT00527.1 segregation/condensation protein A [Dulcicalothrix desertica PCC 7102]TWH53328.1 condensin subunit ScpA [Dulcicalothrix desertica PCC 7102]
MDASELLETITQLIHQAESGDIDPWDVKVIDVIDRFLELMATVATRGYETDLSTSGQAFLSASMLVLFKANTLTQLQAVEEEPEPEDGEFADEENVFLRTARLPLERALRRRSAAMPPSKRRVTLPELIEQLHVMAEQLKKVQLHREVKAPRSIRNTGNNVRTMRQALDLAHQENLTEVALELEQLLYHSASELSLDKEWMDLEQLVALWLHAQPNKTLSGHHSPNSETVGVFWALLLLSAQSKVELYQEEFYTDIKIRLLTDASTNKPLDAAV